MHVILDVDYMIPYGAELSFNLAWVTGNVSSYSVVVCATIQILGGSFYVEQSLTPNS